MCHPKSVLYLDRGPDVSLIENISGDLILTILLTIIRSGRSMEGVLQRVPMTAQWLPRTHVGDDNATRRRSSLIKCGQSRRSWCGYRLVSPRYRRLKVCTVVSHLDAQALNANASEDSEPTHHLPITSIRAMLRVTRMSSKG